MAKPFDATVKELIENDPASGVAYLGFPTQWPIQTIDADLATVTTEADKVLRIDAPEPWLVHIEFQTGPDPSLLQRLLRYNVLLTTRHQLPVHSALVLLRPAANAPKITGLHENLIGGQPPYLQFRYQVVRAWEKPVAEVLEGGLGTLPLAPLCALAKEALPGVIQTMKERIEKEAPPGQAHSLWSRTYILMGLRYDVDLVDQLLSGVRDMEESVTYQAILAKGEAKGEAKGAINEARRLLVLLGSMRFGEPDDAARQVLNAIIDVAELEQLNRRLLNTANWQELLGLPPRPRRSGGRKKKS